MRYGTELRFIRTYDEGPGWVAGSEWTVGPGDDQIPPGQADALTNPAADGEPFAEIVDQAGDDDSEDDRDDEGADE